MMGTQENPPDTGKQRIDWEQLVGEVMELDGDWCKINTTFAPAMADYVKKGRQRAFIPLGMKCGSVEAREYMREHWEVRTVTVSKVPHHRVFIYVRQLKAGATR